MTLPAHDPPCHSELDRLAQLDAHRRLGLTQAELLDVALGVWEDRMACTDLAWGGALADDTLRALLAELGDPPLRATVLQPCHAVAQSDRKPVEAEAAILRLASERWGTATAPLRRSAPGRRCNPPEAAWQAATACCLSSRPERLRRRCKDC